MAENDDIKAEAEKESPEKPKSMMKFIILGVLVVVLAGGGFAGWKIFLSADPAAEGGAEAVESSAANQEAAKGIICPLESFIVNLMDPSGHGKRYLKTTINLEVAGEENQLLVKEYEAQLRDTILLLLSSQSYKEVSSLEGKLTLKQALLVSINKMLGGNKIRRLYFTEFVVQ